MLTFCGRYCYNILGLIALFPHIFCQLCDFAPNVFKRAILHPIVFPLSGLKAPTCFSDDVFDFDDVSSFTHMAKIK